MRNILYIPDRSLHSSPVVRLLEKRGLAYTEHPLEELELHKISCENHFLCILEIGTGERRHLDFVEEMKGLEQLSGVSCPPIILVVEKNLQEFERSARAAQADFYFTAPLEEYDFYRAIAQSLVTAETD